VLNSGGVGSGKTYSIVLKTLSLVSVFPGIFVLIGAQTYPLLRDTTLREFLATVPPEMIQTYNKTTSHFTFTNGSEVIFRPFDDPNKLKSLNLGACGIEEMTDVKEEVFKMIRTRMRQPNMPGCVYGATNPGTFGNWVYRCFIETPILNSAVVYSRSTDNEYLPEEYLKDLDTLKLTNPEYYNRMVEGIWGQLEGLVYLLPSSARIEKAPEQYHRVIAGLDFGYNHPTALVIIGELDGVYYLIDEVYRHKLSSSDVITIVREKIASHGVQTVYCDSARPEIIEDLKRAGVPARESVKDVFAGIMYVKSLIGSGKLFILSSCTYTIREFDSYIWDAKSDVKEIPLKINDDCMDAVRYCVYTDSKKLGRVLKPSNVNMGALGL
jgi:phage terminase large subunit